MRFRRRNGLIHDRRRRKPTERFQLWLNIAASSLLAVPMVIEPLKQLMPEHFYGVVSSIAAVLNLGIGGYRLFLNHGQHVRPGSSEYGK